MAASSSRGRSSSPYGYQKSSSPYSSMSSSSSSSSFLNGRLIPRSCSSSSFYGSSNGFSARSMTPSCSRSDSMYNAARSHGNRTPVPYLSADDLIAESVEMPRSGDSISITVRFRPLSEREFQRGDEIAWYADGDRIVRSQYNPATAYAFDEFLDHLQLPRRFMVSLLDL